MDWKKQRFMIRSNNSINKSNSSTSAVRMEEECKRTKNDGDGESTEQEARVIAGSAVTNVAAECSMCGDVGLVRNLFRCSRCNARYQHTYCSNWYPHERSIYIEVCNWCAPQAMGKAMNTTLLTSHPTRHMDHVDNAHQNNSVDADNNDKNDDVGMSMYSTPRKTHDHDHHPAHAHHRLIKKTSKRLVVRRYKFVSEV